MSEMIWDERLGYGFYPVEPAPDDVYDRAYWDRYVAMADTDMARALDRFRTQFTSEHFPQASGLIDVGIGSGAFLKAMGQVWRGRLLMGCDVNVHAIDWLEVKNQYADPMSFPDNSVPVLCFWDSLEHLPRPAAMVRKAFGVCVSIPIFRDQAHALNSKHFRPEEHFWYWTERGLVDWMKRLGFTCLAVSAAESELGREDILSFAFRRADGRIEPGFADGLRRKRS